MKQLNARTVIYTRLRIHNSKDIMEFQNSNEYSSEPLQRDSTGEQRREKEGGEKGGGGE